jgi:hypothetical protein
VYEPSSLFTLLTISPYTTPHHIRYQPLQGDEIQIDWSTPWKRIPMIPGIEAKIGTPFPDAIKADLGSAEANQFFKDICAENDVACGSPQTTARLIDKLVRSHMNVLVMLHLTTHSHLAFFFLLLLLLLLLIIIRWSTISSAIASTPRSSPTTRKS